MGLKFLADVHISPITVNALKEKGYNRVRITEILSATTSDLEIINVAYKEKAVIITQDLDFSGIIAQSGLNGPGVISIRLANAKPEKVSKILLTVLPLIISELNEGAIVSINEREYRIRKLPFN